MGMYDTFVDGEQRCQVKMFENMLETYNVGDAVPREFVKSFVIVFPRWEGAHYAIIINDVFRGLYDELTEEQMKLPRYSKWGGIIDTDDADDLSPIVQAIKSIKKVNGNALS